VTGVQTCALPISRNITAELEGVHGHEAISLLAVEKRCKQFGNGRITLKDGLEAIFVNLYGP
jgi:hypothetical protein